MLKNAVPNVARFEISLRNSIFASSPKLVTFSYNAFSMTCKEWKQKINREDY
jgi:hypothetical protein